ncbi:transcriptional regulator [Chromobacterium sp. LK11]|nr:AraC family transcriptional regulator [Chromobacterium sp. LK11]KMN78032.1 transcriptional regulator [Chromobacterium sp. LK11]
MARGDTKRQFKAGVCGQSGVVAVEATSSRSFSRHTHDQFGIGVVMRGAQDSASGRGEVRATPGNMITVNPNEVHDGRPVAGKAREWRMLYLDPELIAQTAKAMGYSVGVEFIHPVLQHPSAVTAFGRLYAALTRPGQEPWHEILEQELFQILPPLLGDARSTHVELLSKELSRAKERIDAHPEIPVSLAELAAEAGLSRFHFLRIFKAAMHLPPHAYRLQRQLQMARRLIMTGHSLLQASYLAGFADQSHLTRHFISNYGLTPGSLSHSLRTQHLSVTE